MCLPGLTGKPETPADNEGRHSMIRTMLAVSAIAIGITAVAAQSDPIAQRKELMKGIGGQTKTGAAMAKGEAPYDQAKAQAIFASYVDASQKAPTLFPDNSKTGD